MSRRQQLKLLDRNMLGYYSRAEMALVLGMLVLEEHGFKWASIRALSAFYGHSSHALYTVTTRAHENGLVEFQTIGKNKTVALTTKGKELVNGAITRVTRFKQPLGEVS